MQVLISLEIVICFNLKYAIDFEKVINTVNKKKKSGGFPWLPVNDFPVQTYSANQVLLSRSYCQRCWAGWEPWQLLALLWGSWDDGLSALTGTRLSNREFSNLSLSFSTTETQLVCSKEGDDRSTGHRTMTLPYLLLGASIFAPLPTFSGPPQNTLSQNQHGLIPDQPHFLHVIQ